MTSSGTAETANTWSTATLGQCHPVCPTTRTDQANPSHPSKASEEHAAARHLSGVAPRSISLASFPGAPLMRGAHGTPTLPPSVATRNTALFSPHHPSLWGPRTGRSVRPEGTHDPMPAGEQGHVRSASQGMGGFRTENGSATPGMAVGTPLPNIPPTLPGSWEAAGTSRTKSPSSSRRGGHLREGKKRARGYPPSRRPGLPPARQPPAEPVGPPLPQPQGAPAARGVPTVPVPPGSPPYTGSPPASAAPVHRSLGEPQHLWLRRPCATGAPGVAPPYTGALQPRQHRNPGASQPRRLRGSRSTGAP